MKLLKHDGDSTTWEITESDRLALGRPGQYFDDSIVFEKALKFLSREAMNSFDNSFDKLFDEIKERGSTTVELSLNELRYLDVMIPGAIDGMDWELPIIVGVSKEDALKTHKQIKDFLSTIEEDESACA